MGRKRKNPAAVALGRKGGKARSDAKAAASRENGKRGGRPRKVLTVEDLTLGSLAEYRRRLRAAFEENHS